MRLVLELGAWRSVVAYEYWRHQPLPILILGDNGTQCENLKTSTDMRTAVIRSYIHKPFRKPGKWSVASFLRVFGMNLRLMCYYIPRLPVCV